MAGGLLLPGALRTAPERAYGSGLEFRCLSCVTQPEQPEHSCRSQLLFWPCNGGTMPGESSSFTPSSSLVRPHQKPAMCAGLWWRRRVLPPGPMGLFRRTFIAIVSYADTMQYRANPGRIKGEFPNSQQRTVWQVRCGGRPTGQAGYQHTGASARHVCSSKMMKSRNNSQLTSFLPTVYRSIPRSAVHLLI